MPDAPLKIAVSSCLLGDAVRYDGEDQRDHFISDVLSRYVEFVALCPEVGIGLGVPRAPIRLVRMGDEVRVRGVQQPQRDVTAALRDFAARSLAQLATVSGYLFKSKSPSCGVFRVKVRNPRGQLDGLGEGAFAGAIRAAMPLLPVEEEGRLADPRLRENFITRVVVYQRWRQLRAEGISAARLADFQRDHRYLLMAHNQAACRRLERLVAEAGEAGIEARAEQYVSALMHALARPASPRGHGKALSHLVGCLQRNLDAADRAELHEAIEAYRGGVLPLMAPIALLNQHLRRHPKPYLERQAYLHPHPIELALRQQP